MNSTNRLQEYRQETGWSGLKRIEREYLRSHRTVLVLALAALVVQAVLSFPVAILQGGIIDLVAPLLRPRVTEIEAAGTAASGQTLTVLIGLMLLGMIACHLGRMLIGWKVAATMSRVTLEIVRELTDALHRKLQRVGMSYFDSEPTGCIMARLTSDVGSLLLFLNSGSLQLLSDLIMAACTAVFLFWIDWRLALIGTVPLPLFALNHRRFAGVTRDLSGTLREQVSRLYSLLSERIPAARTVRTFAAEGAELAEFDRLLDGQRALDWACTKTVARQGSWSTLINGIGIVAVLTCGAMLVSRGRLSVGEVVSFSALLSQLYPPIVRLTGAQAMLAGTQVAVDRIVELLDEPEIILPRAASRPRHRPRGQLVYRDVSFRYARQTGNALDGISVEIEPGMTLGIMGTTGAGKSTLLALAPRIYDLGDGDGQGAIFFNSRDIRTIHPLELRHAVTLVPQQALLFEGTLRSNLTYAHTDARARAIGLRTRDDRSGAMGSIIAPGHRHPRRPARPDRFGRPAPAGGPGPRIDRRPLHFAHGRLHKRTRCRHRGAKSSAASPRVSNRAIVCHRVAQGRVGSRRRPHHRARPRSDRPRWHPLVPDPPGRILLACLRPTNERVHQSHRFRTRTIRSFAADSSPYDLHVGRSQAEPCGIARLFNGEK